ncbi:hypothetical protein SELR_02410 [Selenomonas ruminantium subsp. lactilytica TAM6421]|uniref:DUF5105 domain-containing protein n=1 Tax=Selenomonas ruminantium subsp. lactilytica (strain NBRC 103574 / TAM6421) TaxID=927704 RepID=I0GMG2_SELRL|nr:hypothetical protein [Selenomonas ruminantium]BAL81949.1 hypothetical protein SELR_02410 [Selenomonas ruminantium subsp. lactilytica TAM6421]
MYKRILLPLLVLLAVLCLVGCGAEKPKESADKAVLGYAELYAFGISDNLSATGMTKAQSDKISEQVIGNMLTAFAQFPLSEKNVEDITAEYVAKVKVAMDIKTKIKKDDDEHPVVEVSADVIDQQGAAKVAATHEDLIALGTVLAQLRAQGITDEQIKGDADFQKAVMECVNNYIDEIPLKSAQTLDVPCELAEGDDGKMYWAPKDPEALGKFLAGMK